MGGTLNNLSLKEPCVDSENKMPHNFLLIAQTSTGRDADTGNPMFSQFLVRIPAEFRIRVWPWALFHVRLEVSGQ